MSLIDKIPPLVSALAFGYGVGMAAPDHTLATVQSAVVGPAPGQMVASRSAPLGSPMQRGRLQLGIHGDEADTLATLRTVHENKRGDEVSEMRGGRALQSRLRNQSEGDDPEEFVDDDELDNAETAALSRLQMPDLKLSLSKQTIKYVRYFTRSDRGRDMFETWLKRSGRFQEMVSVFEKSQFPKGRAVNGRQFLQVLDDTKDHFAGRTPDFRFMAAAEASMQLDAWRASLLRVIRAYAAPKGVPVKVTEAEPSQR